MPSRIRLGRHVRASRYASIGVYRRIVSLEVGSDVCMGAIMAGEEGTCGKSHVRGHGIAAIFVAVPMTHFTSSDVLVIQYLPPSM
jgi:hypothetical protein